VVTSAGISGSGQLILSKDMISDALAGNACGSDDRWTKNIAVGDKVFIEQIKEKLGYRGKYRKVETDSGNTDHNSIWHLRESCSSYKSDGEDFYNESNGIFWEDDGDLL